MALVFDPKKKIYKAASLVTDVDENWEVKVFVEMDGERISFREACKRFVDPPVDPEFIDVVEAVTAVTKKVRHYSAVSNMISSLKRLPAIMIRDMGENGFMKFNILQEKRLLSDEEYRECLSYIKKKKYDEGWTDGIERIVLVKRERRFDDISGLSIKASYIIIDGNKCFEAELEYSVQF